MPSPKRLIHLHWTLLIALACAIGVGLLTPADWRWPTRIASGWDAGVGLFLLVTMIKLARIRSVDKIRERAAELDDAGSAVLPVSWIAAVASVVIVVGETATKTTPTQGHGSSAILTMATVALSWCFIHLIFAEHYAHGFYGPGETGKDGKVKDRGGLIFPGEKEPDYWDFIHFALIIGVASQTADIQISDRRLRRISSIHSVTAFVFNTVILALAVNFAVSQPGG
jgi:uncharacterized membrane protein